MGEMLHVACGECAVDLDVFDGFGMLGPGVTLCSCLVCKKLVTPEYQQDERLLACTECGASVTPTIRVEDEVIVIPGVPGLAGHQDRRESVRSSLVGECPGCGGPLRIESVGLWD